MNCNVAKAKLSALVDGELDGNEMIALRRHLDGCQPCQREYRELRMVKMLMGDLPVVEPPFGLENRLIAALDRPKTRTLPIFRLWVPAAAAVAAAVLTFVLLGNLQGEPKVAEAAPVPSSFELDRDQAYVGASNPFGPSPTVIAAGYATR